MSSADADRIRAEHSAIAEEANFFGYDLSLPGWQYTEAVCPAVANYQILQYRRTDSHGAQSLFTAMVPRRSGRVLVVPVLYRNATPFKTAVGSERSLAVFNRVVSSSAAEKALQTGGSWLRLGMCYAAIVGAEPRVPRATDTNPGLMRAPAPTLLISEERHTASVSFTDRNAPHSYTVWDIDFDSHGRAIAATSLSLADYRAMAVHGTNPEEKPFPTGAEPKVIPLPPASQPKNKPLPPQQQP